MKSYGKSIDYVQYHENKPHGEVGFPFSIYDCRIPFDLREVLTHWHEEIEIIYVKKGKGIIAVDASRQEVEGPAIILVLSGQLHTISQCGQERMEYTNYLFHPAFLQSRDNEVFDQEHLYPFYNGSLCIPFAIRQEQEGFAEIADLLRRMEAGQNQPLVIKSLLFLLCYQLQRCFPRKLPGKREGESSDRLKPVLSYVQENYAEQIRVADAARLADFSEAHFMRFFKENMGISFVAYLKNYRLTRAEEMVRNSQQSMLEIAQENGFANFSYFIRAFKEKYGTSPLKYREKLKEGEK